MCFESDFLVIGSGLAGLRAALKLSEHGTVNIVTKLDMEESETKYAQGGIASVMSETDSFNLHYEDTIKAGVGLCHEDAVRTLVEGGPAQIKFLVDAGVRFSVKKDDENSLDLGREGGHSKRRIVHACDFTGLEIERSLVKKVRERKNIKVFENNISIDLITAAKLKGKVEGDNRVLGAYILDRNKGKINRFVSKITFLATGGAGKVYLYTSNPDVSTGDGIAMAYRAGAPIANMEFIQFHPTCLYHPKAKSFLVTEALRGDGAILKLKDGSTFMENYHPMGCLAPRDVVARAIDSEMKKRGDECVYLDITDKDSDWIKNRFPTVYNKCLNFGIDITKELIPVVPAVHFMCGGVKVDIEGRTGIKGLYACGETSHTGVHGANRLASNSLLESMVFSERAALSAIKDIDQIKNEKIDIPEWDSGKAIDSDESVVVAHNWEEVRRTMSNYVGIVRSNKRLERAKRRLKLFQDEIKAYYWDFIVTSDLIELRNITTVAEIIVRSALWRKESRGLHYNIDYPSTDDAEYKIDTIVSIDDNV
ncbi:MAG: L-aspartate oxidase [Nitrospinota bacterium]|nr:L-aspartate oxidase [Nitrospinota bacterium]